MFTGIVEGIGRILTLTPQGSVHRLEIDAGQIAPGVQLGDSISVGGACLTAVDVSPPTLAFELAPETLAKTSLGAKSPGASVNLERALRVGDRLGGHWVMGHVDATGEVVALERADQTAELHLRIPDGLARYVIAKGSITIDGVSLTVAGLEPDGLWIALIPHTLEHTTLGALAAGDAVNIEVDVLAKYIERLQAPKEE